MIMMLPETPNFCFSISRVASGVSCDEAPESLQGVLVEGGDDPAAVGPGLGRAGPASELEQSGDGRDVDGEPCGELPPGTLTVIDGVEDAARRRSSSDRGFMSHLLSKTSVKSCAKRM